MPTHADYCSFPLYWESIYCGGAFFTQTALMVLSSVCFSSRIREFVVEPRKAGIDALEREVEEELEALEYDAETNPEYKEYLTTEYKEVLENLKRIKDHLESRSLWIRIICSALSWIFLVFLFLLIIHGKDDALGFCPLLFMLHLLFARGVSALVYSAKIGEFQNEKRHFSSLRKGHRRLRNQNSQRDMWKKMMQDFREMTGNSLVAELPKKSPSRKKTANGSAGSKKKPSEPPPADGTPDNK